MTDCLLGLDIGTSCVKAGLFDPRGTLLASASAPLSLYAPHPGWAEQEPEDWWQGACQLVIQVLAEAEHIHVTAVGLSGQCPGHVLVDRNGQAIGRAIIWRDQRATEEARWLRGHIPPVLAAKCLGIDCIGDPATSPARLLWLKTHRKEDWQNAACVLQPKDYIALKMTGQAVADRHSAYCLINPQSGQYDPSFVDLLEIEIEKLPPTLLPTGTAGLVSTAACLQSSLPAVTPVVTGTIDAYCENLTGGVACQGRAVDVAGTSEIISLNIARPVSASGIYPAQIGSEAMFLCGPTQAGGETLRWLGRGFYPECRQVLDYSLLEKEAAAVPADCQRLVFLPYLNGERTPLWDSCAKGCFFGITFGHTRQHFTRAVYESIGYAIRHVLELSKEAAGEKTAEVVVCGGGSRSTFWNQVKADILQRPVRPAEVSETGCLGAAILAGVGAHLYPGLKQATEGMVVLKETLELDHSLTTVYNEGYRIYRELCPALQLVFFRYLEPG